MILIAHRGNTNGKLPDRENTNDYIKEAIAIGFDVELDICKWDGEKFYLGHDDPGEPISIEFLQNNPVWCHAKDYKALEQLVKSNIHCFYHNTDKYTITSGGYIWAYPGQPGGDRTIAVHPHELPEEEIKKCAGVCSDYIEKYKEKK